MRHVDSPASWLSLLIDGCSIEEFEAHRARLISDGRGDRATIESEARQALHLRALLDDHRRRAAELGVLIDLVRRLSAMRQPGEVLAEIAAQSRRLLDVDLGYIMLSDEAQVLTMEVVNGSIGSALRGARIPPGAGVGGLVMQTGQPRWTADYPHDSSLRLPDDLFNAAAGEGLTAVLGVPLRVGTTTIGVLFVADRRSRTFADHEINLLASLAAHGAIAIHNARLFDEYQRTAAELDRSNRSNRRAVEIHEQLTAVVLRGGGLGDVIEVLAGMLDATAAVLGPDDTTLARTAAPSAAWEPEDWDAVARLVGRFDGSGAWRTRIERAGGAYCAVVPIVLVETYAGSLVVVRESPFDEETAGSVGAAAIVTGLVLASEQAVAEAERRAHGELVAALLSGHLDEQALYRRAARSGVDLATVRTVAVLEAGSDTGTLGACAGRLVRGTGGWAAEFEGRWVVLLPLDDAATARGTIEAHIATGTPVTGAVAAARGTVAGVQDAYRSAVDSVVLLLALDRAGTIALADELGAYRTLFSGAGPAELARFVDANLGPLIALDDQRSTEFVQTLDAYLMNGGRHASAAAALQIHVNTLYQRLARITEVLGEGWREPDRKLELQLALHLRRLSRSLAR